MLFNSFAYLVFLPVVIAVFFCTPQKIRWAVLLAFSYYFYMSWDPNLIVLILFTTITSYLGAIIISRTDNKALSKTVLIISVGLSLLCLLFFKYFNFFSNNVTRVMSLFGLNVQQFTLDLILPVGISFYTFQTLSYVIDVYKGRLKAEKHFGIYALYVSFFPQLVAGPIERATSLLPQFRQKQYFSTANLSEGLRKIIVGMFKKVIIADYVAVYVNNVYNDITKYEGLSIILATLLFTVQIYCDFSGYSDIAIGSAKILGFDLMENFKSPYFAKSIKEFWRRWHISLSTWFSDYVYIPLGGSRVKKSRHIFNLLFTFFLSGFWHGAEYNFAVWGIYHGVLLVCESFYINKLDNYVSHSSIIKRRCINLVRTVSTFLLVNIGWMIFRANKMGDLRYIFSKVFKMDISTNLTTALQGIGLTNISFCTVLILVLVLTIYDWYAYYHQNPIEFIKKQRPTVRYTVYYIFALWTLIGLLSVPMGTTASFIYFQF